MSADQLALRMSFRVDGKLGVRDLNVSGFMPLAWSKMVSSEIEVVLGTSR